MRRGLTKENRRQGLGGRHHTSTALPCRRSERTSRCLVHPRALTVPISRPRPPPLGFAVLASVRAPRVLATCHQHDKVGVVAVVEPRGANTGSHTQTPLSRHNARFLR